ncbi:hypothetical protein C8A03DRAFT_35792 [Achaetomium macrosporum]|uniref:Uncharacterized protein n=1 Tax=Achaetomium macrosporum TaxID=79813 RepID=A0AAN7HCK3_9PEZI|nr:hypothetical protein C8A03DRAFT_35792 [Achaetomium macrosporum]
MAKAHRHRRNRRPRRANRRNGLPSSSLPDAPNNDIGNGNTGTDNIDTDTPADHDTTAGASATQEQAAPQPQPSTAPMAPGDDAMALGQADINRIGREILLESVLADNEEALGTVTRLLQTALNPGWHQPTDAERQCRVLSVFHQVNPWINHDVAIRLTAAFDVDALINELRRLRVLAGSGGVNTGVGASAGFDVGPQTDQLASEASQEDTEETGAIVGASTVSDIGTQTEDACRWEFDVVV